MVEIDIINFDPSYQRPEVSETNTLAIARAFSWASFGALVVMERQNKSLWCVDGRQRWTAAKKRGDIQVVPCMVFQSNGRNHEAMAFLDLNTHRKYVSAIHKFMASVKAGLKKHVEIARWLELHGVVVGDSASGHLVISFPDVFIRTWEQDAESAKRAIVTQLKIVTEGALSSYLHKGLWYLEHSGIDTSPQAEKLIRIGGLSRILGSIEDVARATQSSGRSQRICGLGILHLINVKRQRKIRLPEESPEEATTA